MLYYGFIYRMKDGSFAIDAPDFPEIVTHGESLAEAVAMGRAAIRACFEDNCANSLPQPQASSIDSLADHRPKAAYLPYMAKDAQAIVFDCICLEDGGESVKITLSLKKRELSAIDRKARELGITRSQLMTSGALAYTG